MLRKVFLFLLAAGWLCSCGGPETGKPGDKDSLMKDSLEAANADDLSNDAIGDIIRNISSPVEMASFLNEQGAPFNKSALHGGNDGNRYVSVFGYATNFGLLNADLCYLNLYRNVIEIKGTVGAMKIISGKMGTSDLFDDVSILALASSSASVDSLNVVTVSALNNIDNYLMENNKKNISAMIAFGEWIECLNQALVAYGARPDKNIADRIGEQKSALDDFGLVIDGFQNDKDISVVSKYVEQLRLAFEGVKITIELGQPEQVEKDGMLMIVQNEKSIVEISGQHVKNIAAAVKSIREELIAQK